MTNRPELPGSRCAGQRACGGPGQAEKWEASMITFKYLRAAAIAFVFASSSAGATAITLSPAAEEYIVHFGNNTLFGPLPADIFGIDVGTLDGRLQSGNPGLGNETRGIVAFD